MVSIDSAQEIHAAPGEAITHSSLMQTVEELRDTAGDHGCWAEVIQGVRQRANLLEVVKNFPMVGEKVYQQKLEELHAIIQTPEGNHNEEQSKALLARLEEILPLSAKK